VFAAPDFSAVDYNAVTQTIVGFGGDMDNAGPTLLIQNFPSTQQWTKTSINNGWNISFASQEGILYGSFMNDTNLVEHFLVGVSEKAPR